MDHKNLHETFESQADLQRALNNHPETMEDPEELIQYIKDMTYALEDELHEMTGEIGWKPWATSRHVNREGVKSELVDAFQFFMNLCFAVGMTADELMIRHGNKLETNFKRIQDGYDGVSSKCLWCGRALDDEYVRCAIGTLKGSMSYCSEKATTGDGFFTKEDLENKT
jgi:hypothetical protein